jgi:CHAT domain-containing protein/tetratricopeptide (TPR) repeat protein
MSLFPFPGRPSQHWHRRALRWGVPAILISSLLSACAGVAPAPPGAEPVLRGGTVLEREIRGGERHSYPISLKQGQFLRVVVDQNGADVVVRLLDPEDAPVLSVDSLTGKTGEEDCAVVAERAGLYRVEVSSGSSAGRYVLKVERPRLPSDRDRLRVEAVRAMEEAIARDHQKSKDPLELEQRLTRYEKALALWECLGERWRQAEMLFQASKILRDLGLFERAADGFFQAAGLWGELGDRGMGDLRFRVEALNGAGDLLHEQLARWEEAQARYEEALKVAVEAEDLGQQAETLYNLGRLARNRGDARAGIEFLGKSILLAQEAGDSELKAKALNSLGAAYMDLSHRQEALRAYIEALEITQEPETKSSVLSNLGDAYASLGEREIALGYYNDSLKFYAELKELTKDQAITLNNLGVLYQRMGDTEKALEHFVKALDLVRKLGDKNLEASFLTNQGFLYLRRGEAWEARQAALKALELVGDRGGKGLRAEALHALGSACRLLGKQEEARSALETALSLSRESGEENREAEVILELARLEKDCGNLAQALSLVRESVRIVESLRTRVVSQDLRASFLATKQAHYELNIDVLMTLHATEPGNGHAAEALRVSEQARARSLLETLQEGRLGDEVRARELQWLALRGNDTATPEQVEEAQRKLKESLNEYRDVQYGDLRASSPRYADLTQPRPLAVPEIQTLVLDGDALLLEYALGEERSYLWAVSPHAVESFTLLDRDRIEELARRYYELLTVRNLTPPSGETTSQTRKYREERDAEAGRVAAELSRMILEPVQHLLKSQPLLVVADGALQYIPFAALPIPARREPLIAQHEVVSLPSASALAVLRREAQERPAASRTLAVLADPVFQKDDRRLTQAPGCGQDLIVQPVPPTEGAERSGEDDHHGFWRLRHSGKEAEAIAALLPPDQTFMAVGCNASRATALSGELANYRIVHFATHGVVKSDHPELSKLVLSLFDERGNPVDGFLRLNDIYNLELRADLVVLSACRTALGKEIRGEGLVGLTRGFMYAGAARVLATLWSVKDNATAVFMEHFYRAMLKERLSPAAALRQAQLAMRSEPGYESPYFWAGFSLQGEWR